MYWLLKGSEIKVDKHCLIFFSIEQNYTDEIWCDVVPVDVCHWLLRCPWKFDKETINDGYENTYSFVKDGVKVVLGPCKLTNS